MEQPLPVPLPHSPARSAVAPTPAIDVDQLSRSWPQPTGPAVLAVDRASFVVSAGEIVGLLGPNGAGKTTLMQILATLTPPSSGTARLLGIDVQQDPIKARSQLGYLSTTSGLPARLTCHEALRLFADLHGLPHPAQSVTESIERFRLQAFADRFTEGLSTGMRQRLRIACAAVHRPPVLILDEPTAGLDLMATDDLLSEVMALRKDGAAVLYSTHLMDEADRICDRVAVLYEGRLLAVDTPAELCERTGAGNLAGAFRHLVRDS